MITSQRPVLALWYATCDVYHVKLYEPQGCRRRVAVILSFLFYRFEAGPCRSTGRLVTWQNRIRTLRSVEELAEDGYYYLTDDNLQVHMPRLPSPTVLAGCFPLVTVPSENFLPRPTPFHYAIIIERWMIGGLLSCCSMYYPDPLPHDCPENGKALPQVSRTDSAMMLSIQAFINMAVR